MTPADVLDMAKGLGFEVNPDELETLHMLLAAAHDTFEEINSLPPFHPTVDRDRFPRLDVRLPETGLDPAWACRFRISDQGLSAKSDRLLRGKRIVLKDNISVADIPQYNGTDAIEPFVPQMDATLVTRILEAGGCIVGAATCEALSCATVSNTASTGPIFNPWAPGYSAGGSSSGIGSLVGNPSEDRDHETIDMGVGADQGGSIRVPAAFCGLFGLKPTHGLIPYTGVVNCEPTLDHVGPMCKSTWDTALLLEVLAGRDDIDDRQVGTQRHQEIPYSSNLQEWYSSAISKNPSQPLAGRRICVLKEGINAPFMKDEMKAEIQFVCEQFKTLGCIVEEISLSGHERGRALWMTVCRQSLTSTYLGNPAGRRAYYMPGFTESLFPWTQEKWDKLPIGMRNEMINGEYERRKYPHLYSKSMNLALERKSIEYLVPCASHIVDNK